MGLALTTVPPLLHGDGIDNYEPHLSMGMALTAVPLPLHGAGTDNTACLACLVTFSPYPYPLSDPTKKGIKLTLE